MYQYFDKIRPDETSARLRTQNKLIAKLKAENEKLRERLAKYDHEDVEVERWIAAGLRQTNYLKPQKRSIDQGIRSDLRYHGKKYDN